MANRAEDQVAEVSSQAAFDAVASNAKAAILDVRSAAEWTFVGQPALPSQVQPLMSVQWQIYPGMSANSEFLHQVKAELEARKLDSDAVLYVLCRSGARSLAAAKAIVGAGLAQAINIAGGFEGDPDPATGRRGTISGWKAAGLPWRQS